MAAGVLAYSHSISEDLSARVIRALSEHRVPTPLMPFPITSNVQIAGGQGSRTAVLPTLLYSPPDARLCCCAEPCFFSRH